MQSGGCPGSGGGRGVTGTAALKPSATHRHRDYGGSDEDKQKPIRFHRRLNSVGRRPAPGQDTVPDARPTAHPWSRHRGPGAEALEQERAPPPRTPAGFHSPGHTPPPRPSPIRLEPPRCAAESPVHTAGLGSPSNRLIIPMINVVSRES